MRKLTMMGHSMGGMTALETSFRDQESFKYCVSMDPFFKARWEQILENDEFSHLKSNLLILSTQHFHSRKQRFLENYPSMNILCKYHDDYVNFHKREFFKF